MGNEKEDWTYENLFTDVEESDDDRAEDLLMDPATIAATRREDESEWAVNFGGRLRTAREMRGFSIEEISKTTHISTELLTQVEKGEAFLPLGDLVKLGKALSMKMSDVISTGEESYTIVHPKERKSFTRFGKEKISRHGYVFESLASGKKGRLMEPFIVTLLPSKEVETATHDGQEFIFVLEGEVEVIVNDTIHVLGEGSSAYYDSTSAHLVRARGEKPSKILAVFSG